MGSLMAAINMGVLGQTINICIMTRLANDSAWSTSSAARECLKHWSKFQTPDKAEGQMFDGTWCQTRGVSSMLHLEEAI